MDPTLDDLRRFAVARSLFAPTTLGRALARFGFVQADPIRAPARAQDLTLRHRVRNYRAGDLERRYATLDIEEDVFINYGFVTRAVSALMHPRRQTSPSPWLPRRARQGAAVLEFVRERGAVHPREVDAHFAHGRVTNYWGGSSNATTRLLDHMHYGGLLRVARREAGVRVYATRETAAAASDPVTGLEVIPTRGVRNAARDASLDALVDVAVDLYAPLPSSSLSMTVRRLRYAVPQWREQMARALERARTRLSRTRVDGVDWYWPANEALRAPEADDVVRLLAPFDPVVWDRQRFETLWGWAYRFEAYTPAAKRRRGYYALPLLWRERIIGWANLAMSNGDLVPELGYIESSPPSDRAYRAALEAELERMRSFLGLDRD